MVWGGRVKLMLGWDGMVGIFTRGDVIRAIFLLVFELGRFFREPDLYVSF